MNNYKSLSDIINKERTFENFRKSVDGYTVVDEFHKVFPELKNVTKAKKFEGNILFIHAENSVWRSELNLHKEKMIAKINKFLGKEIIKNIKFI
jgi:predicted nucleic acid-binding Zn ribbon protein